VVALLVGGGKHAGGLRATAERVVESIPTGHDCSNELTAIDH
jgi:hypothetical protein